MDLDFSADFKQLERALTDVMRRQLPFAMMLSLNDTASEVKQAEERSIDRTFDRPTPFTKRGVYVKRANKSTLTSTVGMKPVQAGYLKLQAKGGVRLPKRRALVIGAGLRRNKYGNLPKDAVKRAEVKGKTFVARNRGPGSHLAPGIYQRVKARGQSPSIKMLVSFKPRAHYKKRFEFQPVAMRSARAVYEGHLVTRLKQAQASARK